MLRDYFISFAHSSNLNSHYNCCSIKFLMFCLQLEMEQDDVIEVYQEQTGGRIQP